MEIFHASHRSSPPVAEPFVLPGAHPLVTSIRHRQGYAFQGLCAPKSFTATWAQGEGRSKQGARIRLAAFLWQRKGKKLSPSTPYNTQPDLRS